METGLLLALLIAVAVAASTTTYSVLVRRDHHACSVVPAAFQEAPDPYVADHADFDEEPPEDAGGDAVEIDPANPPKTVFYNPRNPTGRTPHCICHDRDLVPGTEYLWWPMADGSVRIYCKDRT